MASQLGSRLAHVHLTDGTKPSLPDEHLVPGRGSQPCRELLELLPGMGFGGVVVVEISTRRALTAKERYADLAESLRFAKAHLPSARVSRRRGSQRLMTRRRSPAPVVRFQGSEGSEARFHHLRMGGVHCRS